MLAIGMCTLAAQRDLFQGGALVDRARSCMALSLRFVSMIYKNRRLKQKYTLICIDVDRFALYVCVSCHFKSFHQLLAAQDIGLLAYLLRLQGLEGLQGATMECIKLYQVEHTQIKILHIHIGACH